MFNTINSVRQGFLDYFIKLDHTVVESSSLVPRNDPTLLFTNSGMVQFKNVFTGVETRPYQKVVSVQKCVRAGGKHNDLDNVGYTARHHTFFEMLGNFSFGDYFKEQTIHYAWNMMTKEFALSPERLWVTVYASDDEAFTLWRKISGLPENKIIRIDNSDNFWRMGDTGPCGPSSEIFYDHGTKIAGGPPGTADADGDRFVELWNLVFMQYDQRTAHEMVHLPKLCIDTGMSIERISAVLQGKHDNYDTDILRNLILASAEATGVEPDGVHKISHRVLADHIRTTSFLIADGVLPSNEGRGYVLRRIMRRAMRHAHKMGCKDPVMYKLVPALVQEMGGYYKELVQSQQMISETLKNEETIFKQTLDRGLRLLEDETAKLKEGEVLPGDVTFKLYDTFGFPLDLTQDVLRTSGRNVDVAGFNESMEKQRRRAREAWVGSGDTATEIVWFELLKEFGPTEFLGYKTKTSEGNITAIVKDGKVVPSVSVGDTVEILTNQTPFYAESGGQIGDAGILSNATGAEVSIKDTQKKIGSLYIHVGTVTKGKVNAGDVVVLKVNEAEHDAIRANHSAAHLLHAALRLHLGNYVTQKGSMIAADHLRFDISYPKSLTAEDIAAIETSVYKQILKNTDVSTRIMTPEQAKDSGAMALFSEKYGDEVRVVSMGDVDKTTGRNFSIEICGGTHVRSTGEIGLFKIISENAVAANIRRIEAVTGKKALDYLSQRAEIVDKIAAVMSERPEELTNRIQAILTDRRKLKDEVASLRRKLALNPASGIGSPKQEGVKKVNGVNFITRIMEDFPPKEMRSIADDLSKTIEPGIVALVGISNDKATLAVRVSKDLLSRFNAVSLMKIGVASLEGKGGGGQPEYAQGGGPNAKLAVKALEAIEEDMKKN